jgi:hypothetical protein
MAGGSTQRSPSLCGLHQRPCPAAWTGCAAGPSWGAGRSCHPSLFHLRVRASPVFVITQKISKETRKGLLPQVFREGKMSRAPLLTCVVWTSVTSVTIFAPVWTDSTRSTCRQRGRKRSARPAPMLGCLRRHNVINHAGDDGVQRQIVQIQIQIEIQIQVQIQKKLFATATTEGLRHLNDWNLKQLGH